MKRIASFFLTLVMLFGFGRLPEETLSKQYQAGNWDGHRLGIIRTAEVKDGILYMNAQPSDYPADSSKPYYMPSVVSSEKGTWFADAFSAYKFDLVLRFDRRGENIRTMDFRQLIGNSAKYAKVALTDDGSCILVLVRRADDTTSVYGLPADPDAFPESGEPYELTGDVPAYHIVAQNVAA